MQLENTLPLRALTQLSLGDNLEILTYLRLGGT